jgi:hypothetical protein
MLRRLLVHAMRAQARGGPQAAYWRDVVVFLIVAEALAGGAHDGPPHGAWRIARSDAKRPFRRFARGSVTGRRPRG